MLSETLIAFLKTKNNIRIIGYPGSDKQLRVSTISFVHERFKSSEIVEKVDKYRIGIRYGDFYAKKIVEDLRLVEKNGVVRVSMVHYNTLEELQLLTKVFEKII
jgi:selenocysteine lyase/cysteine desulfurase